MAFANECKFQHMNYQISVLFVAQDIPRPALDVPEPEVSAEPAKEPETPARNETKAGQLTLF